MPAPDLRFDPPSGSALPAGDAGVIAWTAPADAATAFFLVGRTPGLGDLWPIAGSPALALGEPIPVPIRAEGPTFVLGVVEMTDLTRYATLAQYRPLDARESLYAAAKRMLRSYFFTAWLGPDRQMKSWCPAVLTTNADEVFAVDGPDAEASCAPWTPAEVTGTVGYALVTIQGYDSQADNIVAGADSDGRPTAGVILWLRFAVELAVPARLRGADKILENRRAEVVRLFTGLTLLEAGLPRIEVRQLADRPVRGDVSLATDSSWLRRGVVVQVRAHARILQIGTQEV